MGDVWKMGVSFFVSYYFLFIFYIENPCIFMYTMLCIIKTDI